MNEWDRLRRQAQRYKDMYPKGTRLELISMSDPFSPVDEGTRGTVQFVDDMGTIHMHWDNGRTLAVVPGEDLFRKLTEEELIEENEFADNDMNKDEEIETFNYEQYMEEQTL